MSNLGYKFEVDEVDYWRKIFPDIDEVYIYRVEGSGRSKNATKTGQASLLEGDVSLEFRKAQFLPKDILIECKHYKSKAKQKSFSVKKEWLDQALHEAETHDRFSIVAIKFKGVAPNSIELQKYCWCDKKFGNSIHYIMPAYHFTELMQYVKKLKEDKHLDLSLVSTDDLLNEVRKRLDDKRK